MVVLIEGVVVQPGRRCRRRWLAPIDVLWSNACTQDKKKHVNTT
jgi:hypothetical protein